MTDKEAYELLKKVEEHLGIPVRPVNLYCDAVFAWLDCAQEYLATCGINVEALRMAIVKSAALNRFLYMGESVRTVPCPKHKGTWSGCHLSDQKPCECTSRDGNITGWLPNFQEETYHPVWVSLGPDLKVQQHEPDLTGGVGTEE